jgi:hypothetical protein
LLYFEPKKQQKKNNFLTICKMGAFFCGKPQKNRALRGSAIAPAPAAPWLNPSNPLRASPHPFGMSVF